MEGITEDSGRVNLNIAIPNDLIDKLDELAKAKYRGVKRQQAVRWIIEDAYKAYEEEAEKK